MDFRSAIAQALCAAPGWGGAFTPEETAAMLESPPDPAMGDLAFPCFKLARTLKKAPPLIAADLAGSVVLPAGVARAEAAGGYLNFTLERAAFARSVLERIAREGARYGGSDAGGGRNVCIDYSSVNIAKPLHIGHLPSTVIGNALYRIFNHLGYRSVGINHLGDWGTQFGKMIYAYKAWGSREAVERGGVDELVKLYVRFHQEAEGDEAMNDAARAWFKKIEDGDAEAVELFSWFKQITLAEVQQVFDLMDIHFDSYAGESFYNDKMGRVVDELRQKGLLKLDQGAQIVDLSAYKMPPCIILRSDGATLYITRDLAAAFYRHNTYHFDKCLYVVAYQQNLHFKQLFKIIELMGHDWYKGMEHVSFGMVSYEGRALSTREGYVVYLEDLLNKAVEKAREIIEEKSPNLPNKDEVARQVGVGAVVYFDLHNDRNKDIDFRWERALNFDGETGPYVQYTHARCCSVLRKAEAFAAAEPDYSVITDDEAQDVLMLISHFPQVVRKAMEQSEPSMITRHTTQLAQAYNKYYFEHRIMDESDPAGTAARVNLTRAVRDVIKTGLYLIGVEAPERM